MDSPASDSENESYQTDDSEYNYIPGPHLIDEPTQVEEAFGSPNMVNMGAEEPNVGPYADEPVADEVQGEKTKPWRTSSNFTK